MRGGVGARWHAESTGRPRRAPEARADPRPRRSPRAAPATRFRLFRPAVRPLSFRLALEGGVDFLEGLVLADGHAHDRDGVQAQNNGLRAKSRRTHVGGWGEQGKREADREAGGQIATEGARDREAKRPSNRGIER